MEIVYNETSVVSLLVANPHLQKPMRAFMAAHGLTLPEICTPIELAEH